VRASLLAIGTLTLCAACAGPAVRSVAWRAEMREVVGIGEGATIAAAHEAAVADLAAQVRAQVEVRSERLAEAGLEGDRAWSSTWARRTIAVGARLSFAELARRQRASIDGAGRATVVLRLDRAAWAGRRRAAVASDAAVVLAALRSMSDAEPAASDAQIALGAPRGPDRAEPPARDRGASPVADWHELGRAVASARAWRIAEMEAAAVDPSEQDGTPAIDRALVRLVAERDARARGMSCVARVDGDAALEAVVAGACGALSVPTLLGPPASDARRLLIRGRVERTLARDAGLVFAESRVVLTLEGDGRTLETLVVGGAQTRRGHLDEVRAIAGADAALQRAVAAALAPRFR
jgi:hypothetical protein